MSYSNAFLYSLQVILRSAPITASEEETQPWLPTFCEVLSVWNEVISPKARKTIATALKKVEKDKLVTILNQVKEKSGHEAALAARSLTKAFTKFAHPQEVKEQIETLMTTDGHIKFKAPKLDQHQRRLGEYLIDRLLFKQDDKLPWIKHGDQEGIAALALLQEPLSELEKLSVSHLLLDAVVALHSERLEPDEGFAPEKMIVAYDFSISVPKHHHTEIPPLKSPERKANHPYGHPSDVWALGQLLIVLFTGQQLGQDLALADEVPVDLKRVIERCLHPNPKERLYSAKEVKVVMKGPLKAWLDRLSYEEEKQESSEEEALPYDELTAQREENQEARVQKRRKLEVKLRKSLRWRATRRQSVYLAIGAVVLAAILVQYKLKSSEEYAKQQAQIAQILKHSKDLDIEDQAYQVDVVHDLASLGFKWRLIPGNQETPSFLMSTTEVTYAQYKYCVQVGECKPIDYHQGCVWGAQGHENDPMNCLNFGKARSFAKFVGGDLPLVEQWMWATTHDGVRKYPWGDSDITKDKANLEYNTYLWERGIRPVCSFRLGDSPKGLCDLIGSMSEWVIISETGEVGSFYQLITGVMGGSWLTSPEFVNTTRPVRVESDIARFDVGFRVVRTLPEKLPQQDKATEEQTDQSEATDATSPAEGSTNEAKTESAKDCTGDDCAKGEKSKQDQAPKTADSPSVKPSKKKPSKKKPSKKKPSEKKPSKKKPSEKKPSKKKPSEKKPSEKKPSEKKPSEKKPSEKKPSEKKPSEKKPSEK